MVFVSPDDVEDIRPANFLSWLFEEAPADADRPLLIDAKLPNASLSWAQAKELVHQLAAGFRSHGLKRGDCLCIVSQERVNYWPTVYACIAVGAVFYGGSPRWTPSEYADSTAHVGVTHFLVDAPFVGPAAAALEAGGGDPSRVFVFTGADAPPTHGFSGRELVTWSGLRTHGTAGWDELDSIEAARGAIAMRINTGGTSGTPKVPQLSHYCATAHIYQWCRSFKTYAFEVKALQFLGLERISGFAFISTAIKLGFPVYLLSYSIPAILEACETIQPSLAMIDPHTMVQLVKQLPEGSQALRSFRDIRLPAMDFPANARKMVQAALHPDCMLSRPYGLTEIGTVSAMLYKQRVHNDPASVGHTFPGVQIKLVDADDGSSEITRHDAPGELLIRTPAMFTDYYGNAAATAAVFRDGWFVTGDIGYISSATQQWYVVGRKDFVFRVAGKYVAPEEVESLLVSHPDIGDAAVMPVYGEGQQQQQLKEKKEDPVIRAFVMPKTPGAFTEEQVLEYVEAHSAPEKRITGGVKFVKAIPRNQLHRVVRWKLAELDREDGTADVRDNGTNGHH